MTAIGYGDDVVLTVRVRDGQYHVQASHERDDPWPDSTENLTTGEENWFAVICGTAHGPVTVRVRLLDSPPDDGTDSQWEIVTERDIVTDDELHLVEIYAAGQGSAIATGAGTFRVRVHAKDRMVAYQAGGLTEALESHELWIWPTDGLQDPQLLTGPDEYSTNYS
ncbi:hypothetical protein [Kutzneria buriramensis]|uniref:Uncharacterized protein n=1 Tax=Kutzneria buriramensis TaxID=1045776 RepID=A0A3E0HQL3_9PSEU|nr:hypothetical protein [Kutzneria buriramensis]REH48285.1 hypothetical protein BCF44_105143 [Kutzneria buriramensis]